MEPVNHHQHPVINHETGKEDGIVTTTNITYPWLSMNQIFFNSEPSHDGDLKTIEVMTST